MELAPLLEGTALGEFFRQLSEADGTTLSEKIDSLEQQLIQQEQEFLGSPYYTQTKRLRDFTVGLRRLEKLSLLRPLAVETALAA